MKSDASTASSVRVFSGRWIEGPPRLLTDRGRWLSPVGIVRQNSVTDPEEQVLVRILFSHAHPLYEAPVACGR